MTGKVRKVKEKKNTGRRLFAGFAVSLVLVALLAVQSAWARPYEEWHPDRKLAKTLDVSKDLAGGMLAKANPEEVTSVAPKAMAGGALAKEAEEPEELNLAGGALAKTAEPEEVAKELAGGALAKAAEEPEVQNLAGGALVMSAEPEESIEVAPKALAGGALAKAPEESEVQNLAGGALVMSADPEESVEAAPKAMAGGALAKTAEVPEEANLAGGALAKTAEAPEEVNLAGGMLAKAPAEPAADEAPKTETEPAAEATSADEAIVPEEPAADDVPAADETSTKKIIMMDEPSVEDLISEPPAEPVVLTPLDLGYWFQGIDEKTYAEKLRNATSTTPTTGVGYCAAWVSYVYQAAGLGFVGGNACDMWQFLCNSQDSDEIHEGMIIAVRYSSSSELGMIYGHCGVLLRNNDYHGKDLRVKIAPLKKKAEELMEAIAETRDKDEKQALREELWEVNEKLRVLEEQDDDIYYSVKGRTIQTDPDGNEKWLVADSTTGVGVSTLSTWIRTFDHSATAAWGWGHSFTGRVMVWTGDLPANVPFVYHEENENALKETYGIDMDNMNDDDVYGAIVWVCQSAEGLPDAIRIDGGAFVDSKKYYELLGKMTPKQSMRWDEILKKKREDEQKREEEKKRAEEEAARLKAEEEAAAQRKAEEEAARLKAEQEAAAQAAAQAQTTQPQEIQTAPPTEVVTEPPATEPQTWEQPTETPAVTPPAETPPAETPPAETPPAETPPAETPPAETPPAETPPAETPPAETQPADPPMEETPPITESGGE